MNSDQKTYNQTCNCLSNFYREGRACYICTECGKDIALELAFLAEIGVNVETTHTKQLSPSVLMTGEINFIIEPICRKQ